MNNLEQGKVKKDRKKVSFRALGPGILYAGAAIGASHLIFSTRAGADYSYHLIWAIILINLFKYPFFEFSYRYTAATGESVLTGYKKLGKWAILSFFIISIFTAIINFAAVTKVTSDLTSYFFNIQLDPFLSSSGLLIIVILFLFIGKYTLLDIFMKVIIMILGIFTIIAFFFALNRGQQIAPGFIPPELWDIAGLTFILALMGWMPTPIDASVWPSVWAVERNKQKKITPTFNEYRFDFHVGYIGSAFMALFFLGLGALVMYGSGNQFSADGVKFSQQLVSLYSESIGSWSQEIIATIILITMFSTALTVIDGYPRSLEGSVFELFPSTKKWGKKVYMFWISVLAVAAVIILGAFTKNMKTLLVFATVISFLTAPLFAFVNYKVVTSNFISAEYYPKKWLRILAIAGIVFLVGFSLIYMYFIFIK